MHPVNILTIFPLVCFRQAKLPVITSSNWPHQLPYPSPTSPSTSTSQIAMKSRRSMPSSLLPPSREEQWKRFQCSGCGHRSNWKWDINKHIKVAHPERKNITTVTMALEEARTSLPEYLDKLKGLRSGRREVFDAGSLPMARVENCTPTGEGYYRPFKCSMCGHRLVLPIPLFIRPKSKYITA